VPLSVEFWRVGQVGSDGVGMTMGANPKEGLRAMRVAGAYPRRTAVVIVVCVLRRH
jgi:hypothetical protein